MKKNRLLNNEFWLTIVKYALAIDALSFEENIINITIKKQILDVIKKHCGNAGLKACQQMIDINFNLKRSQAHQRTVQCARIQKANLLPEELLAELQKSDWPTTDIITRSTRTFGIILFSPGADINADFKSDRGSVDLGLLVYELSSRALLNMLLNEGFQDRKHSHGKTCLEYLCNKGDVEMAKVLLADKRYQHYDYDLIHKLLITALREHKVKLVELFLQLPLDYLENHNLLVWPMESLARQILENPYKSFVVQISAKELKRKKAIVQLLCAYRNPQGKAFPLDVEGQPFNILTVCAFAQQVELLDIVLANTPRDEVKRVINQLSDVTQQTALGIAAALNHYPIVFRLLNAGADPNLPIDDAKSQPLARTNTFNIRLLLQQRGAKPNVFNHWQDFDLEGKEYNLRPLVAEALYGTVETLQRVIDQGNFGSVDMTEDDACAPILYALSRLFGLIPEAAYQRTGDRRSIDDIITDSLAKFNLLMAKGAQVNAPLIKKLPFTLLDFAIWANSTEMIETLAPHQPKTSPDFQKVIQAICLDAVTTLKNFNMLETLVKHTIISNEIFHMTLGFLLIGNRNNDCLNLFLENVDNFDFNQPHQNFIWRTLLDAFNNDKASGKPNFYAILNQLLWLTTILPPALDLLPEEQNTVLAKIYIKMVTGRYGQMQESKQKVALSLNELNAKFDIKSMWSFSGHTFHCHASTSQAEYILKYLPGAAYNKASGIVSIKIKDPNFQLKLPEKNTAPLAEKIISSRHFLMEKGYTADQIAAMRQAAPAIEVVTPKEEPLRVITWCDGKISSQDDCIIHLENSAHYLFIDQEAMLNTGCSPQDLKKLVQVRQFGDNDNRCVAPLKGKLNGVCVTVRLCDQELNVPLKGEIRDAGIEARLLCGPALECDQKGAQLYVAVVSVPSMHTEANVDNVLRRTKVIELNYPTKADLGLK